MKMMRKLLSFVIGALFALIVAVPVALNLASAATTEKTGLRVKATDNYEIENLLSTTPLTYEASFKITAEEAASSTHSYIVSNYSTGVKNAIFNLRVQGSNGHPILSVNGQNADGSTYNGYNRLQVNVATGEEVHLAVTIDNTTGTFHWYVNGVDQTSKKTGSQSAVDPSYAVNVKAKIAAETSYNTNNKNGEFAFKGELYSVAMYSDTRTATEIATAKTSGVDVNDTNLMVAYDFTGAKGGEAMFQDLSKNKNNVRIPNWTWSKTAKYNPDDYAFSFMVVGDTQQLLEYSSIGLAKGELTKGNTYIDKVYDYIVANISKKKVKHVFGVGDITEYNSYGEWSLAQENMSKMDGKVSYSVVPGNHDTTNWFVTNGGGTGIDNDATRSPYYTYHMKDGSIQPIQGNTANLDKDTTINYYNMFFGEGTLYEDQWAYSYVNTNTAASTRNTNTIHFFEGTDELKYMVVALEYGPTQDVLDWVSDIISQYPNHNVIITTHGYMWADENRSLMVRGDENAEENGRKKNTGMIPTAGPNGEKAYTGDEMWDYLVSQHENITMLLCGHVPSDTVVYRQDKGVNGNTVTQMVIDPSNIDIQKKGQPLYAADSSSDMNLLTGLVATYYVSADGKTIDIEWYSPLQDAYYLEEGQFRLEVEAVKYSDVIEKTYSLEVANDTAKGSVEGSFKRTYKEGDEVSFTIDCVGENTVKEVRFNGRKLTADNGVYTVTIAATDNYLEVVYNEIVIPPTYTVAVVNDAAKGSVSALNASYEAGASVTFTITPIGEYTVKEVRFNGRVLTANGGVYTANVAATDNLIEVVYNEITVTPTYGLTVKNDSSKGSVSALNERYEAGETLTFTVTPVEGATLKEVRFNGRVITADAGVYTVTVAATDNLIEAVYNETYVFVVMNDDEKGTVAAVGAFNARYEAGAKVSFTVTAIGENAVKEVRFNGRIVNISEGVYTITIVPTVNLVEVVYQEPVSQVPLTPENSAALKLTIVNDNTKGTLKGSFDASDAKNVKVTFTVTAIGENKVVEVKLNGRKIEAADGVYTVTVTTTENVIEVVYDTPSAGGFGCAASAASIVAFLPLCGLAFLKKRKED